MHAGLRFSAVRNSRLPKRQLVFEIDKYQAIQVYDESNKLETLPNDGRIYNGFIKEAVVNRNSSLRDDLYRLITKQIVFDSAYRLKTEEVVYDDGLTVLKDVYEEDPDTGLRYPVYMVDGKGNQYGEYKNEFKMEQGKRVKLLSSVFVEPKAKTKERTYKPLTLSPDRFYFYLVKHFLDEQLRYVILQIAWLKPDNDLMKKYLDMFVAKERARYEESNDQALIPFNIQSFQYLLDLYSKGTDLIGNTQKATATKPAAFYDDKKKASTRVWINLLQNWSLETEIIFPPIEYPSRLDYTKDTIDVTSDPFEKYLTLFKRVFPANIGEQIYKPSGEFYNLVNFQPYNLVNIFDKIEAGGINKVYHYFLYFQKVKDMNPYRLLIELEFRWMFNDPIKFKKINKLIEYNFIFDLNYPNVMTDRKPFFFSSVKIKSKKGFTVHKFIDHICLGKYLFIKNKITLSDS